MPASRDPYAPHVTVYSTGPACKQCEYTCNRLAGAGISYEVVDLTEPSNASHRQFVTQGLGYRQAPVVVVDGDCPRHWSGFRPDLIDELVAGRSELAVPT